MNQINRTEKVLSPSEILGKLRSSVMRELKQEGKEHEARDGMDMALCMIDPKNNTLTYSGANRELLLIRNAVLRSF